MSRKVYGRVLTKTLMKVTKQKVSEEQGWSGKGKGCLDQVFTITMMEERNLGKNEKLYSVHGPRKNMIVK